MCSPSPTGPHSLTVSGQLQVYPGDEHFGVCLNHNCMEFHYFDCECGGEGLTTEEQKALWTVATGEGIAAIVRALDQYPDALKLNLHHGSLQLYNCLGDIAASIPMRPNQLAELELELARSSGH